jgi:RNA polymerase sigma-B factor
VIVVADERAPAEGQRFDAAWSLQLLTRWQQHGDVVSRDAVVVAHGWIAEHIARRFADRGDIFEDLVQVGHLALVRATDRYDLERGVPFAAYAMPTVAGEVRRYFRDATWSVRVPRRAKDLRSSLQRATAELSQELGRSPRVEELAARLGVHEEQVLEAMEASSAYRAQSLYKGGADGSVIDPADTHDDVAGLVDHQLLRSLLAELPERERLILYLRFFEEMSQSDIAARVGTSQVHVSRLIRASLDRLHDAASGGESL